MQPSISEILKRANSAPTKGGKIKVLREEINKPLLDVIIAAYDTRIQWLLPKGKVEYTNNAQRGLEGMLYQQTRTLYMYVAINGQVQAPGLSQFKREMKFIEMLESLDVNDAVLMTSVKDKKLPYPTLTTELIHEAFPGLLYLGPSVEPEIHEALKEAPVEPVKAKPVVKKRGRGRPRKTDVQNTKSA